MAASGADAGVQLYSADIEEARSILLTFYKNSPDSQDRVNAIFRKVFQPHQIRAAINAASIQHSYKVVLFGEADSNYKNPDPICFQVMLNANDYTLVFLYNTPEDMQKVGNAQIRRTMVKSFPIRIDGALFEYKENQISVEPDYGFTDSGGDDAVSAAFVDLCKRRPAACGGGNAELR